MRKGLEMTYYLLPVLLCSGLYVTLLFLGCDIQGSIWAMISAAATCVLAIAAIIGFRKAREVAQLQTSLQFCADMHERFQKEEFKQREKRIYEGLKDRKICPISDLPDALREDIKTYCGFMDNIGVLIKQESVNPEIVIAYYGAGILFNYDLIKPYLDLERLKQFHSFNHPRIPAADVTLIKDAYRMEYAHYELLALQIREKGPKIVKDFEMKLRKYNAN